MNVSRIGWVGVRTDRYNEMRRFVLDGLGLHLASEGGGFLEATATDGSRFEIFGPGTQPPAWLFSSSRVVAGFEVDDIVSARDELAAIPGVELLGNLERGGKVAWQHFRAPDGNVYEITGMVP